MRKREVLGLSPRVPEGNVQMRLLKSLSAHRACQPTTERPAQPSGVPHSVAHCAFETQGYCGCKGVLCLLGSVERPLPLGWGGGSCVLIATCHHFMAIQECVTKEACMANSWPSPPSRCSAFVIATSASSDLPSNWSFSTGQAVLEKAALSDYFRT